MLPLSILQNAPLEHSAILFDLHYAIISLEKQFLVFLKVVVLHRFYCMVSGHKKFAQWIHPLSTGVMASFSPVFFPPGERFDWSVFSPPSQFCPILLLHQKPLNGYFGKQWRPRWNIASGSTLFAKTKWIFREWNRIFFESYNLWPLKIYNGSSWLYCI